MHIKRFAAIMLAILLLLAPAYASEEATSRPPWLDKLSDAGSKIADKIRDEAPDAISKAKDKASDLVDKAKEKAPEVIGKAKDGLGQAQDEFSEFRQGQEDEFWAWFENQTGQGSSDQGSSSDTAQPPASSEISTPDSIPKQVVSASEEATSISSEATPGASASESPAEITPETQDSEGSFSMTDWLILVVIILQALILAKLAFRRR